MAHCKKIITLKAQLDSSPTIFLVAPDPKQRYTVGLTVTAARQAGVPTETLDGFVSPNRKFC